MVWLASSWGLCYASCTGSVGVASFDLLALHVVKNSTMTNKI